MVNYMSVFLPSLQEKLIPIYFITRKGIPFFWGEEQQKAFQDIKHDVTHAPVLLMPNSTGHFVLVSCYVTTMIFRPCFGVRMFFHIYFSL